MLSHKVFILSMSEMQNNSVSSTIGNHTAQLKNFSDFKNECYVLSCCDMGIGTQIMHVNDKACRFFIIFIE